MGNRDEKHLHKERLCYFCDRLVENEKDLRIYSLSNRGYGSIFDSCFLTVQLCVSCVKPEYKKWFNEKHTGNGYGETYEYEEKIKALIESFPIENQEYIWNYMNGYPMDRQDWIDMELGLLSDEKYEAYGMYSPRQQKAYQQRFSTCKHPVNVVYSVQSKGCSCPFGAHGEYNQTPSVNISDECFNCTQYEKRTKPIKEMSDEDYKMYKKYIVGKNNYLLYKNQFEEDE